MIFSKRKQTTNLRGPRRSHQDVGRPVKEVAEGGRWDTVIRSGRVGSRQVALRRGAHHSLRPSRTASTSVLARCGYRNSRLRRAVSGGFGFYPWLHTVWEFENLADYEPFQNLVRPKD